MNPLILYLLMTTNAINHNQSVQNDSSDFHIIINASKEVKRDMTIDIDVTLINNSNTNWILYNFRSPATQATREESFFCDDSTSARVTVIIYDNQMKPLYARVPKMPKAFNYRSMTQEVIDSVMNAERKNFRNNLKVIQANTIIHDRKKIDVNLFNLARGTYFMKLLYISGYYNSNFLTGFQIQHDEEKHHATVFMGCSKSNIIPIEIE